MARKKFYEDERVQRSIYLSAADLNEMQDRGISITKFFNQAWEAYKDKKFQYTH
ncbi:MAG: hypothetical protein KAX49_14425 [Halanaerobiales bacterium]|nr:hypothetical protein [Halanaerobiales bacterium]